MSTKDTYSEIILNELLVNTLKEGISPDIDVLLNELEIFKTIHDLSKPLFKSSNYRVSPGESSSSIKFNDTGFDIQRDLTVLYKELYKAAGNSYTNFDRWRNETDSLERQLKDLESRINSLLLLANDSAGYLNYIEDQFNNNSKINTTLSTIYVDTKNNIVTIGSLPSVVDRLDTSFLREEDIEFGVLTTNNIVGKNSVPGSKKTNMVVFDNQYWQENVFTNKPGIVSTELKINLKNIYTVSQIQMHLHMSNQGSSIQVTPMYSIDNYNWKQLPSDIVTLSVKDKAIFQFTPVDTQWFKFIFSKQGPDNIKDNIYKYEFGADDIAFFNRRYTNSITISGVLFSQPLSITDTQGEIKPFTKLALETCEYIPENTDISYFISTTTTDALPGIFSQIDPINRINAINPTILNLQTLDYISISGVYPSYNPSASIINPAQSFNYVSSLSNSLPIVASGLASAQRYSFHNTEERILNYSISPNISFMDNTFEVWRNVGRSGSELKVRGTKNGWNFTEPYYSTTIYINKSDGLQINFGSKPIVIDETNITGSVILSKGVHTVKVHKDNWIYISPASISTLIQLRIADSLYPYNHRYLIEGFPYQTNYIDEKIYRGADIVAEFLCKKISSFDLVSNITSKDYSKFAFDKDAFDLSRKVNGSSTSETQANIVVLVKVDETNSDFINEEFLVRFRPGDTTYKYIWLKAILTTSSSTVAPYIDSYRIKTIG